MSVAKAYKDACYALRDYEQALADFKNGEADLLAQALRDLLTTLAESSPDFAGLYDQILNDGHEEGDPSRIIVVPR